MTDTVQLLANYKASGWQFWQVAKPLQQLWYLYAMQGEEAKHLGAFANLESLAAQQHRFLNFPNTSVSMPLAVTELRQFLAAPELEIAPRFCGQLGSQWSGYNLKPLNEVEVELIYAADFRHELLGVFTEAEAFQKIEQHYDTRRQQCRLC